MTPTTLPPVWFERPVLPEMLSTVSAACTILGPATSEDSGAGVDAAVAAVVGLVACDAAFMDRAPGLKVIARNGIGYDNVDVIAATERGIAVCNTPDGPTVSTAEHAVTLMLLVAKNIRYAEAALRTGATAGYYVRHQGIELDGKVLGLVGFGRIARHVVRIAAGLGMRITTYDPFLPASAIPAGVERAATLEALLAVADVVSIHVPLTDATRGLFGATAFASMKPGAVFINTARGGLVDHDALLEALEAGRLFGVGLDVTDPEPLPVGHPLLGRDDVVVTPHVASGTADGKARIFRVAFEQAMAVVEGRRPEHLVNPEVWERIASVPHAGVGK
ncbi:MAG: D-3-phosphoglycerate dehydrogenase / 2-oxoglutarate reductase [Chloroflexota bacterium]|nr:D-3-phosphoglycerate dehydrogenase / 2-oxoglutarate reductase [Chloroflexota bacterium]